MTYYHFDRFFALHPCRLIDDWPYIKDGGFNSGRKIAVQIPDPLEFILRPFNPNNSDMGPELPDYFKGTIPLFRDDFLEAFKECGVTNLQVFNASIKDPDNSQIYSNYKAVNIIGELPKAALGLAKGDISPHKKVSPNIDKYNTEKLDIFRVEDAVGIFVSEKLKNFLQAKGFNDLEFNKIEEVAV